MIYCKHIPGRVVPIFFNSNENFTKIDSEYFFICHFVSGYAVLLINGERNNISSNMLICFPRNTSIEILSSYHLVIRSISFAPEFINVHLTWQFIENANYSKYFKKFDFPSFDLFYKHNVIYNGILPMETTLSRKVSYLLDTMFTQLTEQPTDKWSCYTRSTLYLLLDLAESFQTMFMQCNRQSNLFIDQVIDYINSNFCSQIRIGQLCALFHTNRTTLSYQFKVATGLCITDYILKKRICLAQSSLATTKLTIENIAEKHGFSSASHFIKVFVKFTGITPTQYRKHQREIRNKIFGE